MTGRGQRWPPVGRARHVLSPRPWPDARAVVAARLRRAARYDLTVRLGDETLAPAGSGSAPSTVGSPTRSGSSSTACRSSSAASTGSPTTASPPGSPASASPSGFGQAVDAERQPAAGLGRRPLRVRRLLRPRRRARACWSGRTSRSPAPPTRRRSRSRAEVEAEARDNVTRLATHPEPGAVERQQREHRGPRRLGLAGGAGRPQLGRRASTTSCCRRSWPSSTRRAPYWPGQPRTPARPDLPPNDPERGTVHIWDVWNRDGLHPLRRLHARGSWPSSASRAHPTYATLRGAVADDPLTPDSPGVAAPPEGRRRQRQAAARTRRRTCPQPGDFDDWHYLHPAQPGARRRPSASSTSGR